MNVVINLIVLCFVILMTYWWGRQGLFSAFLHLMITIACGAIALAVWEPLAQGLLLLRMPQYAWGVGLLAPFVLLLLVVRLIVDRVVHFNVYFSGITNWIGGCICGLFAGGLTAGLTVIGLGFLGLPPDLMGYQPYFVETTGEVAENPGGRLWISFEQSANSLYALLSGGSFYSGYPMDIYEPDLAKQAALFRLRRDPNASVAAVPGEVEPVSLYVVPSALIGVDATIMKSLGDWTRKPGSKLVIVDTRWFPLPDKKARTWDTDALRVYPPTIRLLTVKTGAPAEESEPELVAPLGVAKVDPGTGQRVYISFRDNQAFATGDQRGVTLGFAFEIKDDREPRYLFARHLRLKLPEARNDMKAAAKTLGKSTAASLVTAPDTVEGQVGPRNGGVAGSIATGIEINNLLPYAISRNKVTAFEVDQNGFLVSGESDVAKTEGSLPKEVRIDRVLTYIGQATIRVKLDRDKAQSLLGAAMVTARSVQGVWLQDAQGNRYFPIGYAWAKPDGWQQVSIHPDSPVESARALPVNKLGPQDTLYLYFSVPKRIKIAKFYTGMNTFEDTPLDVPK